MITKNKLLNLIEPHFYDDLKIDFLLLPLQVNSTFNEC